MNKKRLVALCAAGMVLLGTVNNVSAGAVAVDRSAMATAYTTQQLASANGNETQFLGAIARAAVRGVTRVARTPGIRQFARDIATGALGALTAGLFGGSSPNSPEVGSEYSQVFD